MPKRAKAILELAGDFEAVRTMDKFLSVSRGEIEYISQHGYPILEMLRVAALGLAQRKSAVIGGKLIELENALASAMQRAALVEIENSTVMNMLSNMLEKGEISEEVFQKRNAKRQATYNEHVEEAAGNVAGWLRLVIDVTTRKERGRPTKSTVPTVLDTLDWQVIAIAATHVEHLLRDSPVDQTLAALPHALEESMHLYDGFSLGDETLPWKKKSIILERLKRKTRAWLGSK
jgi:hypothetical protein